MAEEKIDRNLDILVFDNKVMEDQEPWYVPELKNLGFNVETITNTNVKERSKVYMSKADIFIIAYGLWAAEKSEIIDMPEQNMHSSDMYSLTGLKVAEAIRNTRLHEKPYIHIVSSLAKDNPDLLEKAKLKGLIDSFSTREKRDLREHIADIVVRFTSSF